MNNNITAAVKKGLTSYQIKIIALICLVIEYIGNELYLLPNLIGYRYDLLKYLDRIGRIAAPLFLYMVVESARQTSDRKKFLLRLYFGSVGLGLFISASNFFFRDTIGVIKPGNIIYTFFFTVLLIYLIEGVISAAKEKNGFRIFKYILGITAVFIPHILHELFESKVYMSILASLNYVNDSKYLQLCNDLFDTFLPLTVYVEYSLLFVIMGIAIYFAKNTSYQCIAFLGFWIVCAAGVKLRLNFHLFNGFIINPFQHWMILALPFMALYDGKRGKEHKQFFYIGVPILLYVVIAAFKLFAK